MINILPKDFVVMAVLAGITASSTTALAQSNVTSCADIEGAEERLACYDRAAEAARNLPVVRMPRIQRSTDEVPRESSPDVASSANARSDSFGYGDRRDGPRTQTYRVVSAKHNDFTGWTIEFDNGSTWKQVGTDDYRIEVGEQYSVRRNSFNSYMLSNSENNRKIRISRVD